MAVIRIDPRKVLYPGIAAGQRPPIIQTIIDQMGGVSIGGALCRVGATELTHKCERFTARPAYRPGEGVHFDCGLRFNVNGKRGEVWTMIVAYDEAADTYVVFLGRRTPSGVECEHCEDVYCDGLMNVVDRMYDDAIAKHNGGFISLGD